MKNKFNKASFILAVAFLSFGVISLITACVFRALNNDELVNIFLIISAISGTIAFIGLIIRLIFSANDAKSYQDSKVRNNEPKRNYSTSDVKTVNVKTVSKSREEELYEQYVDLEKQGFITKEQLETKRKDLLGK